MQRVRPVSISHPDHFVNVARRRAAGEAGAVFADQFESPANLRAHLATGGCRGCTVPTAEAAARGGTRPAAPRQTALLPRREDGCSQHPAP